MNILNYTLLDVFTTKQFGGNQLAVFYGEEALSTEIMQRIARELNLSETVFIFTADSPSADKKLRIFTPQLELPMAGHPTIGAAYVLAEKEILKTEPGQNQWIFEEKVGNIPITVYRDHSRISKIEMKQPNPVFGEKIQDYERAASLLSLSIDDINMNFPIQTVSTGVPFLFIPVQSLAAIKRINFRTDVWEKYFSRNPHTTNIFTFTAETEELESTVHSRMFAPAMGISEDPATGAASGPLGAYLVEHGVIPSNEEGKYFIRSEQGFEIGRPSYIDISIQKNGNDYKEVKIGGNCVIMGSGQIYISSLK